MAAQIDVRPPMYCTAVVASDKVVGGKVSVILETYDQSAEQNTTDHRDVFLTKPVGVAFAAPKRGAKGLVFFKRPDDRTGYWIGEVYDPQNPDHRRPIENMSQVESDNGKGLVGACDGGSNLSFGSNSVVVSDEMAQVIVGTNELTLSDKRFNIIINDDTQPTTAAAFEISRSKVSLSNNGEIILRSQKNINLRTDGVVAITGAVLDPNSKDTGNRAFNAMQELYIKANMMTIDSGGPVYIDASNMAINLSSGLLSGGGGIPGTGPLDTWSVNAVQGNVTLTAGTGTVKLQAVNQLGIGGVDIICGSLMNPLYNMIQLSILGITLSHELAPLMGATITLQMGKANMTALNSVTIESLTNAVDINAMTAVTINGWVSAKLTSLKIDIIADMMLKLGAPIMDWKDCNMIDAGPKTVIPNPAGGPFNAIIVCPITGMPHSGRMCTG